MIDKKKMIKRFIKLVKIDSLSKHEGKIAEYLTRELKSFGLNPKIDNAGDKIGGESGNIRAVFKGNIKGAPKIILNAHIDTVSPGTGIKPRVKGNFIVSDGTTILGADNKAGVNVILEVIKTIKKNKVSHGDILILFTVAEEIGLFGAKSIPKSKLKADFGFVLDGGDVDEIINQAPSQDNINVEIIGKAAHAGVRPEEGISAIQVASEAISKMKLGRIDFETTANIGKIKGGIATNIIPEKVKLKGEARSHNFAKLNAQVKHMKEALQKACKKHGAILKMEITPAYESFKIAKNSSLLNLAVRSAKSVGIKPKVKRTGGGSDANIFNSIGVPSLIIGAGADRVHTTQERVIISHMVLSVEFILGIINEVANDK